MLFRLSPFFYTYRGYSLFFRPFSFLPFKDDLARLAVWNGRTQGRSKPTETSHGVLRVHERDPRRSFAIPIVWYGLTHENRLITSLASPDVNFSAYALRPVKKTTGRRKLTLVLLARSLQSCATSPMYAFSTRFLDFPWRNRVHRNCRGNSATTSSDLPSALR